MRQFPIHRQAPEGLCLWYYFLFLRYSRSSSWPCRSKDLLLVKSKCNNCKKLRYHASPKQENKPQHKPKQTQKVPRCLGEKVKQTRPKIPALSPSPQWNRMTSLDSFSFYDAKNTPLKIEVEKSRVSELFWLVAAWLNVSIVRAVALQSATKGKGCRLVSCWI